MDKEKEVSKFEEYKSNIGKSCTKKSRKPFLSGFKINIIKDITWHTQLGIPAYLFKEDRSEVECRKCEIC